jgi:crotonobetainyl-CoA:carnitine CoA-transferase CaiB-like acyl-CoA transferase
MAILKEIFRGDTSAAWLEKLEAEGVPAGPIYKMNEVFADPQVQHLGIVETVPHPTRGDVRLIGQPVVLSRTPASVKTALPDKGAQSDEILREAGYSTDEIARLRDRGAI